MEIFLKLINNINIFCLISSKLNFLKIFIEFIVRRTSFKNLLLECKKEICYFDTVLLLQKGIYHLTQATIVNNLQRWKSDNETGRRKQGVRYPHLCLRISLTLLCLSKPVYSSSQLIAEGNVGLSV